MQHAFSAAIESKPTELQIVALRRGNQTMPAELIIGSRENLQVVVLRPSQLKQLALDAVKFAIVK